jgi:hypothetical protein
VLVFEMVHVEAARQCAISEIEAFLQRQDRDSSIHQKLLCQFRIKFWVVLIPERCGQSLFEY